MTLKYRRSSRGGKPVTKLHDPPALTAGPGLYHLMNRLRDRGADYSCSPS